LNCACRINTSSFGSTFKKKKKGYNFNIKKMKNNNIKEILKLETKIINGEEKQFIDARNLHKFLKSKQEFAN
jgi:hypothetical protein